ncbi:uncharacterized protein LOC113673951 [Pocillopora damicornis]|uniref:uncharacterized protein LOC113673951 n=1 Tax=Pocillopora damicornis TaxID=46731 RepID=UPI000F551AE4|nr:uncharacterized protein LOC113673951 [Pocillopora damicornis]
MAGASLWGITFKNIPKKPVSFIHIASCRCFSVGKQRRHQDNTQFDQKLLKILVCPLTKKPLRYDNARNELISDDIGVAYSIQNGIPNLIPHDGRLIKKDNTTLSVNESNQDS